VFAIAVEYARVIHVATGQVGTVHLKEWLISRFDYCL
jgi:hypothetical protein